MTAATLPETCTTCAADPTAAPGRYCASKACRCGHPECPAFASWRPLERPFGYLTLLHPRKAPAKAKPSAWAEREEPTWIDDL